MKRLLKITVTGLQRPFNTMKKTFKILKLQFYKESYQNMKLLHTEKYHNKITITSLQLFSPKCFDNIIY